ncbi:MAG: hypothetical protein K2O04_02775 [Clostridiales bacterium]|nr:hypothetical protein [Clostridiales bacterium]
MGVNLNNGFWKARLSGSERGDYERLRAGFSSRQIFGISGLVTTDVAALGRICVAALNDDPGLYGVFVGRAQISVGANGRATVTPQYISCNDKRFNAAVEKILQSANNLSTDYEKTLFVKDFLGDYVLYDSDCVKQAGELLQGKRKRLDAPESFTAYGAIVNRKATCDGIAKAACYLLRRLGVQCVVTNGKRRGSGDPHSWNIVSIGDACYHLDVTSDLVRKEYYFERTYHYFLTTDAEMYEYFTPDDDGGIKCDSASDSYYSHNGLRFTRIEALRRYVLDGAYGSTLAVQYTGDATDKYVKELLTAAAVRNATADDTYAIHPFAGGKYFVLIKNKFDVPKRRTKGGI